jgi:hypothetical protein
MSKSSLLWFIRSRSYVTVADLRRRFGIVGSDEVTAVVGPKGRVYVGLPAAQSDMLRDLWRDGKIGFEFQPRAPKGKATEEKAKPPEEKPAKKAARRSRAA